MFLNMRGFKNIDVSMFDSSKTTAMQVMFANMFALESINFGDNFDTSHVYSMQFMFAVDKKIQSLDLSTFNTPELENSSSMFARMTALKTLNIGGTFNTKNVYNMESMFSYCSSLETLTLGENFETNDVSSGKEIFRGDTKLKTINAKKDFVVNNSSKFVSLFYGDTVLVGGRGTTYNSSYTNGTYAKIDCGTSRPGYFTYDGTEEEYDAFCAQFN